MIEKHILSNGRSILVFDDPEPENEIRPLFFSSSTELEERYKKLQFLPGFLSFSKIKRKLRK